VKFIYLFFHLRFFAFICFIFAADLPNGVIRENGLPVADRRTGKKHKRRNSSRPVDGKIESFSSEKENTEDTHPESHLRERLKFNNSQDNNNG